MKKTYPKFTTKVKEAFSELIFFPLFMFSVLVMFYYTDWYLVKNHFHFVFYSIVIVFIRNITELQICVVSKEKYEQFTLPMVVFILAYPSNQILMKHSLD